ncbi:alpha/beta fold hydrolase [Crystallibacter crystallopoietes]|uniref:alpha/beta fold hydrolase n=1 Tax=Crystallibacter crystallopoietes TaxID=37928 RepID=UPI001ED9C2FB|nr:alpha/beta fold hydrolase [Arthrobacter crystallopoietes]
MPADADAPTILFVHGYPDDHSVFSSAITDLGADHRVLAYDTRNAGASRVPVARRISYRLPVLVDDLFAVLEACGAPAVHVVGHDWGSIQGWAAVQDARSHARILSFTSISGPDLRHFRHWFRHRLSRPVLWRQLLGQALRSSYVAFFQLPVLPELAWRAVLSRWYKRLSGRSIGDDGARGVALYRANLFWPQQPTARLTIPVQVIVPRQDPFLSPHLVDGLQSWVTKLRITEVDAGHWWPAEQGSELAALMRDWIGSNQV